MVQRQEHPQDRRLVVCRLTSRGSETVERLHQAGRGRMAALLDGLSVDDLRKVVAGLAVLSAAASPSADQPPAVASTPASWQPKVSSAS